MSEDRDALVARIERLELELTQLREGPGQGEFGFRDAEGRKRVELIASEHDTALVFRNKNGGVALSIGVDGTDCGYLTLCNADGKVVAKLDVERYAARLELLDSYWNSESAVIIHGNDCDDDGGWIKLLSSSGDDECLLEAPRADD